MIQFKCLNCNTTLETPDNSAGTYVPCHKCRMIIPVPGSPVALEPNNDDVVDASPLADAIDDGSTDSPLPALTEIPAQPPKRRIVTKRRVILAIACFCALPICLYCSVCGVILAKV